MAKPLLPPSASWLVLLYLALGLVWVLASDQVAHWLLRDAGDEMWAQSLKGAAFVVVTAGFLFAVMRSATVREDSQQQSHDESLAQVQVTYQQMFHANPHPMWIYDMKTLRFLDVNDAAIKHYGYSREEFLAMALADIRPPEDVAAMRASAVRSDTMDSVVSTGPWRHLKKDGSLILVRISSHRLNFGDRIARLVLVNDVTEQANLQREREADLQALAQSSERLERALGLGGIGLWEHDLRTDEMRLEGDWAEVLGTTPQAFGPMTGKAIIARCHPDDLAASRERRLHLLKHPHESYRDEYRLQRPDRTWLWVLSQGRVVECDDTGRAIRMAGAVTDITQLKAAQKAREESQAALNATAMRAKFLARVSHELRTPLNAVLGFAQLLQLDSQPALTDAQAKRVKIIESSGQHLLSLINDLLDLSRVESGELFLRAVPVDVIGVLDDCLAMVAADVALRDLHIEREVAASLPRVLADATRLKQAVLNLLSNAVKYNRSGGVVRVSAAPHGDATVRVAIWNSGEGLSEDQLKALYEPFNRLGRESGREEGTGIGLALTRDLIERMGGHISADSEPGAWTRFTLSLATAAPAA